MCKSDDRYLLFKRQDKYNIGVMYIKLRCGKWACNECRDIKIKKLRKRIKSGLVGEDDLNFLTLTIKHGNFKTREEALKYVKRRWNSLKTAINKKLNRKIKYISVVEPHKSGYPHLHIIVTNLGMLNKKWLLQEAQKVGFGWNSIVQKISLGYKGAVNYVLKYILKCSEEFKDIKRLRIVDLSRDFCYKREKLGTMWKLCGIGTLKECLLNLCSTINSVLMFEEQFEIIGSCILDNYGYAVVGIKC